MTAAIDLHKAIRNLTSLPALPAISQKLLNLNLDSDEGERQMMLLIEQDPLISAKLIGLANSPLLGASRKVATVHEASMLLGLTRVKSVATGIAVMSLLNKPVGRFDPHTLWIHNLSVSFAMLPIVRAMPAKQRPQDDLVFLAGMLHDIGYLVLAHLNAELSDVLLTRMAIETNTPAIEIERELLGMTHEDLGAELAKYWNLPEEIVAVLRYHHTPDSPEADIGQPLVRIVCLAEKLVPSLGLHMFIDDQPTAEEWEALGIDPADADEIIAQVSEQAEQATQFAGSFS